MRSWPSRVILDPRSMLMAGSALPQYSVAKRSWITLMAENSIFSSASVMHVPAAGREALVSGGSILHLRFTTEYVVTTTTIGSGVEPLSRLVTKSSLASLSLMIARSLAKTVFWF